MQIQDKVQNWNQDMTREALILAKANGTLRSLGASDEEIGAAMKEAIAGKPQRHGFLEQIADAESRRMNEIGG